jgi:hypothetical protein
MSEASDLIERMEEECGCRVDDNGGDNMAITGLFGAMARMLGKSTHDPRDDVVAGVLVKHQLTPEYERQQESDKMMAAMLCDGISPDDLAGMMKK